MAKLPFELNDQKHQLVGSASVAGFQHEWRQGGRLIQGMESDAARSFSAAASPAFSAYFERRSRDEHEARD